MVLNFLFNEHEKMTAVAYHYTEDCTLGKKEPKPRILKYIYKEMSLNDYFHFDWIMNV
jgi:hypothetical protein